MFWFAFVLIILFIILLIYILISSMRTSSHTTLQSRKEAPKPKSRNKREKPKAQPKAQEKAKVQEKAKAPAAEVAVIKEVPAVIEELSEVKETIAVIEEKVPVAEETLVIDDEPQIAVEAEDERAQEKAADVFEAFITEDDLFDTFGSMEEVQEKTVSEAVEEAVPVAEEPFQESVAEPLKDAVEPQLPVFEAPEAETESYNYQVFDNTRTMEEFGLSKEDADDFIVDLIHQIEDVTPSLEEAVRTNDNRKIEEISHMVKGSATNLGTGGIADVLVDFNTYMKTANDPAVIARHMNNFRVALKQLKEQFQ